MHRHLRVRKRSPPTVHPDSPPSSWRYPTKSASGSPPDGHVDGLCHPTNPAPLGVNHADGGQHTRACQGQTSSAEARERVSCQVESTCCQSIAPFNCEFVSGACRNVVCIESQEAVFIGLVTHPLQRMGRGVRRDGSSSALVPRARHRAIVHVWLASIPCAGCGAHGMLCRFCESDI